MVATGAWVALRSQCVCLWFGGDWLTKLLHRKMSEQYQFITIVWAKYRIWNYRIMREICIWIQTMLGYMRDYYALSAVLPSCSLASPVFGAAGEAAQCLNSSVCVQSISYYNNNYISFTTQCCTLQGENQRKLLNFKTVSYPWLHPGHP